MCYVPDGTVAITPCSGAGHADLATVFQTHLQQDLSIAYYNAVDNTRLGGVDFDVPSDGTIIRLCLSGQAVGGSYWTLCLDAVGDNVLSGSPVFCKLRQVPASVSDGCYSISATGNTTMSVPATSTSTRKNSAVSTRPGSLTQEPFILCSFLFFFFLMYSWQSFRIKLFP